MALKEIQKRTIENYIKSYNSFDINGMVEDLHQDIIFENITNGEVDMTTNGIEEFKMQAKKAKQFFSQRKQTIDAWNFEVDKLTIDISYEGVLAIDLPNGANKGDTLALQGQSEFIFKENQIISIKDKS